MCLRHSQGKSSLMSRFNKGHRGESRQNQSADWNARPSFGKGCAKIDGESCRSQQVHS
jgi:hypothetical protein